jgi:hypothetical protein
MLMNRIIGALTFKREVYAEVEKDTSFTGTAWALVAVVGLLSQLGSAVTFAYGQDGTFNVTTWLLAGVVGAVLGVAGFALGAFVIAWVGKALFKADVSFEETVRTLGLAQVWGVIGVLNAAGVAIPFLGCITAPLTCVAAILALASWFVAAQEALDLDTGQTAITVILGWFVSFFVTAFLSGIVFAAIGIAAGGGSALMNMLQNVTQ